MPVSFTNNHNLLTRDYSISFPLKGIYIRSSIIQAVTLQVKSSSDAKTHWVRMATGKAQAPLGGAPFQECTSREVQGNGFLLPLFYCQALDAGKVRPSLSVLYCHFKSLFAFLGQLGEVAWTSSKKPVCLVLRWCPHCLGFTAEVSAAVPFQDRCVQKICLEGEWYFGKCFALLKV